jgi:hypothetical protein
MRVAREFAALGKALSLAKNKIERDLEWLGIAASEYGVQQLVHECMLKCWYNSKFGDQLSSIVNFNWYRPTFAYRYDLGVLRDMLLKADLRLNASFRPKRSIILKAFARETGKNVNL